MPLPIVLGPSARSAALPFRISVWLLLVLFVVAPVTAQTTADEKRQLDHDAYEIWNRIDARALSDDGAWVIAEMGPENHDNELQIHHVESDRQFTVDRGSSAQFSADSRYLVTQIRPPVMDVREADDRGEDPPKDSLAIVALESGEITRIPDVASFRLPEEGGSNVAYLRVQDDDEDDGDEKGGNGEDSQNDDGGQGNPLVLRDLETGAEQIFDNVTSYHFSPQGDWLAYVADAGDESGVFSVETATGQVQPLLTGEADYTGITFDEDGQQLAFLTNRDTDDEVSFTLYRTQRGNEAVAIAEAGDAGIPDGWVISEHGSLSFSEDGTRLFYGTAPAHRLPREEEEDTEFEYNLDDEVNVDIWHWQDERLQTVQVTQLEQERRRTYRAVAHLDGNTRLVQLAMEDVPSIRLGSDGDADVALAWTNRPYAQRNQWAFPHITTFIL